MEGSNKKNKISFFIPLDISPLIAELKREEEEILKKIFDFNVFVSDKLKDFTLTQLKEYCNTHKIKLSSGLKKDEIFTIALNYNRALKSINTKERKNIFITLFECLYKQRECENLKYNHEYVIAYIQRKSINSSGINISSIFHVDHYTIEREVSDNPCSIWKIQKDVLILIFSGLSIQDLGRLEQTSKEMSQFINNNNMWLRYIEKNVSKFDYFQNTPPREFLQKLITGVGYPKIKYRITDVIVISSDGERVIITDKEIHLSRVINVKTGDIISVFVFKHKVLCMRGDYILFYDREKKQCFLKNYVNKEELDQKINIIYTSLIGCWYMFSNCVYFFKSNHPTNLIIFNLKKNQMFKSIICDNNHTILKFMEIDDQLIMKNEKNGTIYDSNYNKIGFFEPNSKKYYFQMKDSTLTVKDKDYILYSKNNVKSYNESNGRFVREDVWFYRLC